MNHAKLAQTLHNTAPVTHPMSSTKYWRTQVKSRADADKYFELYHPEYSVQVRMALLDVLDKKIAKMLPIKPSEIWTEEQTGPWDYDNEIEEQRLQGLMEVTNKRMARLLEEEVDK